MTNPMASPEPVPQRFAEVHERDEIPAGNTTNSQGVTEEDVLEALRDVIDPELGINVVDLGLIYGVSFSEDDGAIIDMTLTSAACPLTDVLEQQVNMVLSTMVPSVVLNWVWMPPWGPDRITEDGRDQLRSLGFNV
ncbi:MAG: metal-sulfur cluster assembly factor [Actinomycetaceae bacterium]|nr:metal-sulfur cluster assembly factor [Actinomycetaceae bacterium]